MNEFKKTTRHNDELGSILEEANALHDFATHTTEAIRRIKSINRSAMDIAEKAVEVAPLGILDDRIHDAIGEILSGVRSIQTDINEISNQIENAGEYFDLRVKQMKERMANIH